jgi:DNA mismatch repair protein MutS2
MLVEEKALTDLGWPALLAALSARTHTSRGAHFVSTLPLARTLAEARERSDEIGEARKLRQIAEPMLWGGVHDLRLALQRLDKGGALDGPQLREVAETLRAGAALRRFLLARYEHAPRLAARAEPIAELPDVSGPIDDSFDPSGRLHDHASPALGPLRRKAAELHGELSRTVRGLLEDPNIAPHLQDKFYTQRDERYVVPIKAGARGRVHGIVHGSSQSGHTVFVEPDAVVDLNNALKLTELEVAEEERRILAELSGYVREELEAIGANLGVLEHLDFIDAAAALAEDTTANALELAEDGPVELHGARHPLMALSERACVPIEISVPSGGTLIISGPNAGGKTVAMKTTGLLALLAHAGLHAPVGYGSRMPLYDEILCDIGDDQSLERNLSTFSAHVLHLQGFLAHGRRRVLVLIDEIAVGTDPTQGAALAQAVLEELAAAGATVLVTTHYDRLKALGADEAGRFCNASVGFDLQKLEPTFELHLGVPGSSGALVLARRLGLPGKVVARAESLVGTHETGVEELLIALSDERRRLADEREAVADARRQAERAAEQAAREARELREQTHKLHVRSYDEAVEALRAARAELDRLRSSKKRVPDPEAAVRAAAAIVAKHAPVREHPGRAIAPEELVPGQGVLVTSLGGEGQVVSAPSRGRVLVQVGPIKTLVDVAEVRGLDRKPRAPGSGSGRGRSSGYGAGAVTVGPGVAVRTGDNTLDLRGERVDDAMARLDKFLDESLSRGLDLAFVLHGHGTGALRAAVREHLARHPAVSTFRNADPDQGGDAVTAVELG